MATRSGTRECIRKIDIPGRYGGDEFLVILPNLNKTKAEEIAESIRTLTESQALKISDDRSVGVTISIGIAEYEESMEEVVGEFLKCADHALHEAKNKGKNRVEIYLENMEGDSNPSYVVKTYFVAPLDSISVIIDTLIKMVFETYTIYKKDRFKMVKVLEPDVSKG